MATAAFTWAAWDTTNAWQNLADAGNNASMTYARDATDVAAKFTSATKGSTQVEFARKSGAGDSWASIFGIATNATVTLVRVSGWKTKMVANAKLTSHTLTVKVINDVATAVTAASLLAAVSLRSATGESSYTTETAGSDVAVNAGSQAATTSVRLSLEYSAVISGSSGSANIDTRFDDVQLTITYSVPSIAIGGLGKATRTIIGGVG